MIKQITSRTFLKQGYSISRDARQHTVFAQPYGGARDIDEILSAHERLDKRTHIMLDRTGTVLAVGEKARSRISEFCCFSIRDDRLTAIKADAKAPLQRLLELAEGEVDSAIVPCRKVGGHILLLATCLCQETILINIHVAAPGHQAAKLVDLTEAFGLTPSEAHIVELLLGGHGPSMIGEELNISVHTVRAHLRHCYDKLGVSSREELWQALSPYHLY